MHQGNFVHSYVNGHLGYFHILTVINNAAVNIRLPISFQISVFFFDIDPGGELLNNMVVLFLVF